MRLATLLSLLMVFASHGRNSYAAVSGAPTPSLAFTDISGKKHDLSEFKGKYVVLEWLDMGCEFARKHYEAGNMQNLQKMWTGKNVIWLSMLYSLANYPEDYYLTDAAARTGMQKRGAASSCIALDPNGALASGYGVQSTLHMFVLAPDGKVIYNGALDDKPTRSKNDIAAAKNYVSQALEEAMAGKPVSVAHVTPYGCPR